MIVIMIMLIIITMIIMRAVCQCMPSVQWRWRWRAVRASTCLEDVADAYMPRGCGPCLHVWRMWPMPTCLEDVAHARGVGPLLRRRFDHSPHHYYRQPTPLLQAAHTTITCLEDVAHALGVGPLLRRRFDARVDHPDVPFLLFFLFLYEGSRCWRYVPAACCNVWGRRGIGLARTNMP